MTQRHTGEAKKLKNFVLRLTSVELLIISLHHFAKPLCIHEF